MIRRWISVAETSEYLGITEAAVRQLLYRRRLAYTKLGKTVRIDKHAIDRDLEIGLRPVLEEPGQHTARAGTKAGRATRSR
jgi:excisionase family DNA binding protein